MRIAILLVLLICACNKSEPERLNLLSVDWASRAGERMEHFVFHPMGTRWLKTTEGEVASIEVLRKDSSYFIVLNQDTIGDSLWNYELVTDNYWFDTSRNQFRNLKLYDDRRLSEVITNHNPNDTSFFIINLEGEYGNRALGIGTIHTANMDNDLNDEYLVEVAGGYRNLYYFFDDSVSGWESHGLISNSSRWPFGEIDDHLEGYFGLATDGWGSGFGSRDYDYYRLDKDSLRLCFTINAYYGIWMFPGYNCFQHIESSSKSRIQNNRIIVNHKTKYEMLDTPDGQNILFSCTDNSYYELIPTTLGRYEPDSRQDAFYASYDSTQFDVSYSIMQKVNRIKQSGTKREKTLLKNIELDSTTYY